MIDELALAIVKNGGVVDDSPIPPPVIRKNVFDFVTGEEIQTVEMEEA
jgi:hypothetical protein